MERALSAALIALIHGYRLGIAPLFPSACRFQPTCSQYGLDAIREHGPFVGSWMTALRIGRCHPLHPAGIDPVQPRALR